MKILLFFPFLPVCFHLVSAAGARADVSDFLAQGIEAAGAAFKPVGEGDRKALLAATASVLAKHVTFRPDGTASSFQSSGESRRGVEWKRLVVRRITEQAVTDADRLNGVSRKFLVTLGCEGHRTWDKKANGWGQWYGFNHPMFPSGLAFEWKNNAWVVGEGNFLKSFAPGPGPSISVPNAPAVPATQVPAPAVKDAGLPPGMSRK